jgi:hypothetical protein
LVLEDPRIGDVASFVGEPWHGLIERGQMNRPHVKPTVPPTRAERAIALRADSPARWRTEHAACQRPPASPGELIGAIMKDMTPDHSSDEAAA